MDEVLHQDALMWSRVQTLIAIQAATLGGVYHLKDDCLLAWGLTILGITLTLMLVCLAELDRRMRDQAQKDKGGSSAVTGEPKLGKGRLLPEGLQSRFYGAFLWGRAVYLGAAGLLIAADLILILKVC